MLYINKQCMFSTFIRVAIKKSQELNQICILYYRKAPEGIENILQSWFRFGRMDRFVHQENIRRYERLLEDEQNPDRRAAILHLLEEERGKDRAMASGHALLDDPAIPDA